MLLKNDIKISIRLNLGIHNAEDIFKLAEFLAEKFSKYDNCRVYAHRLFDYDETGRQIHKEKDILNNIKTFQSFNDYIYSTKLGRGATLSKEYKVNRCTGDSDSGVVISPVGKLTKCEHFSDEEVFGDIYSENLDTALLEDWKKLQPKQEICESCPAFMDCFRICKCPDLSPRCTVYEKDEQIELLKFKMLNTYKKWKEANKK